MKEFYKYIKNKFSVAETEVWDFDNGGYIGTVDPTLPNMMYRYGIAIYLVPTGYCNLPSSIDDLTQTDICNEDDCKLFLKFHL